MNCTKSSNWETRWHDILRQKLLSFTTSPDYEILHIKLLEVGMLPEKGFQKHEDWQDFNLYDPKRAKWKETNHYGDFLDDCRRLGRKFGLSWQTIFESCFLPESEVKIEPFVKPQWMLRPIFSYNNRKYYDILSSLDLKGGWALEWPDNADLVPSIDLHDVDPYSIFQIIIEAPLDYPPEGIKAMQQEARSKAKAFCNVLGREVRQRNKTSPTLECYVEIYKIQRELGCSVDQALEEFSGRHSDDLACYKLDKLDRRQVYRVLKRLKQL